MARPQKPGKPVNHRKEKIKVTTAKADQKAKFADEVKKRKLALALVKKAESKAASAVKSVQTSEAAVAKLDEGVAQIDKKIEALRLERERRIAKRNELHTNAQRLARAVEKEMKQTYAQVKVTVPGSLPPPPMVNTGTAGLVILIAAWPALWKKIRSKL